MDGDRKREIMMKEWHKCLTNREKRMMDIKDIKDIEAKDSDRFRYGRCTDSSRSGAHTRVGSQSVTCTRPLNSLPRTSSLSNLECTNANKEGGGCERNPRRDYYEREYFWIKREYVRKRRVRQ